MLDDLVAAGKIRTYGWSTDRADVIRPFATSPGCGVVQQGLSVLDDTNPELLALCEELDLASINRSPLGMGLLTGKFTADTTFPSNDQRHRAQWHPGFKDGAPTQDWLDKLAAIRDVLTSNGRTLAQGALAWIWARSPKTIPIPGFKTVAQVEENCGALDKGPLTPTRWSRSTASSDGCTSLPREVQGAATVGGCGPDGRRSRFPTMLRSTRRWCMRSTPSPNATPTGQR